MTKKEKRPQGLGEEIGNCITHGIGFLGSIAMFVLMLLKCNSWQSYFGVFLFSISMMMLYLFSTLYHAFKNGSKVKNLFKRFDHLSIYLLIAGTFAPILLVGVNSKLGYIMFGAQWILTMFGIVSKVLWPHKYNKFHVAMFLIIGWSGLLLLPDIYKINPNLIWFILLGGISYSIGVIFYSISKVKYFHFIWHFWVLFGTILHFFGIYLYIL